MSLDISANTQATLLLTAPLLVKGIETPSELLTPREFNRLEQHLSERDMQPGDLLSGVRFEYAGLDSKISEDRLQVLLDRSFQLTQALERWQSRSIWVAGRRDDSYPGRLKERLDGHAPSVVYGCGARSILGTGGLGIVGSRNADDELLRTTEGIGRLAAEAGCTVVSGGARGIDQAAMRGALEAGGRVVGVLADSLERAAVAREHREVLMNGNLVLMSPYDPAAGFNVGNAMQRNKVIYALSDVALVMSAEYEKGGTWAGAVEQLKRLRLVPVFVDKGFASQDAGKAMVSMGASVWADPADVEAMTAVLSGSPRMEEERVAQQRLLF